MAKRRDRRRPAPKTETRELDIHVLGRRGDGISEEDGKRTFVPFALPGERIRADVAGDRGGLIEVLSASDLRVPAPCSHFGVCGGCAVQHLADAAYRDWKRGLVETALARRGLEVPLAPLVDAHGDGRRRMTLHARVNRGRAAVGFMQARGHRLMDIDACHVLTPALAPAIDITRRIAVSLGPDAGEIDIQWTSTDTGLDGDIRASGDLTYDRQVAMADEAEASDLARLTWDGEPLVERRQPTLRMGRTTVVPAPGGFLQATDAGEEALCRLVTDFTGSASKIADLYCGVGPFTLRLAESAQIYAADGNGAAIAALDRAVRYAQNLKPVRSAVRDLARDPLDGKELAVFDAVIFDPPRAGAANQAQALAASAVPAIVAVSCDPGTFARDARHLVDGGYDCLQVTPVDQFKFTGHVEIVGHFRRPG